MIWVLKVTCPVCKWQNGVAATASEAADAIAPNAACGYCGADISEGYRQELARLLGRPAQRICPHCGFLTRGGPDALQCDICRRCLIETRKEEG